MRVPLLASLVALALLVPGCIGKDPPAEAVGAEIEPTEFAPEANVTSSPAPDREPASTSSAPPSSATNASVAPPPENESAIAPVVSTIVAASWNGTITAAGMWTWGEAPLHACCPVAEAEGENTAVSFDVPAGLSGMVVELSWTQGQTPADLDLVLDAPDAKEATPPTVNGTFVETRTGHWWIDGKGSPAETTATGRIVVTDAEALALTGAWTWRIVPKGAANAVPFEVAVSLFTGAPPEESYSALATPSDNP